MVTSVVAPVPLRPRKARADRSKTYPAHRSYEVEVAPGTTPIELYLRLSAYHKDSADSIERQRLDLTRLLAAEGGWTITGEFIDNDSASKSAIRTRKGWRALNQAIDAGAISAVAFWKLDRASRVAIKTIEWLGKCRERGVVLVSHQDPRDELNTASASAKLVIGIKSLVAEIETDTMSDRQKAAKRHAAEAGFCHGGPRPFGWTGGPQIVDEHGRIGHRLVAHPVEHEALKDAVTIVLEGGSLSDVSKHYRDAYGIVTAKGELSPVANIRRSLISPRMMGYRMREVPPHQRGVVVNLMNFIVRDSSGEPVISQEPICDRVTWMRLQKAITQGHTGPRGPWGSHESTLTGVLMCRCGNQLYGMVKISRSGDRSMKYSCRANSRFGPGSCAQGVSIDAVAAEAYVFGWLVEWLSPRRLAPADARLAAAGSTAPIGALLVELDQAKIELAELTNQQGSDAFKGAAVAILLGMIRTVSQRIDQIQAGLDALTAVEPLPTDVELLERWPGMSLSQKRALLRQVIDRIDVEPGRGAVSQRLTITPR